MDEQNDQSVEQQDETGVDSTQESDAPQNEPQADPTPAESQEQPTQDSQLQTPQADQPVPTEAERAEQPTEDNPAQSGQDVIIEERVVVEEDVVEREPLEPYSPTHQPLQNAGLDQQAAEDARQAELDAAREEHNVRTDGLGQE